jgi:hypothetical protein
MCRIANTVSNAVAVPTVLVPSTRGCTRICSSTTRCRRWRNVKAMMSLYDIESGPERQVAAGQVDTIELHAGVEIVDRHRHQQLGERSNRHSADTAVHARRRVPAPAADDHVGILVDGLLQQPVDVLELVLSVGVDRDQELGGRAGHAALDRRPVAAIHL